MSFYADDIALHNDSIGFAQLCHSNSSKNSINMWTDKYTDKWGSLLRNQNGKKRIQKVDWKKYGY